MPPEANAAKQEKNRALMQRRRVAGGLLVAAAILFLLMLRLEPSFVVRLVRAASEAALVGGLADWFAVTAIFRRPLGLPIPHTALIPRRKDEIGRALGAFVRDNILEPSIVVARLRADNRALQFAHWLSSDAAGEFVRERAASLLPLILEQAGDQQTRARVAGAALHLAARIDPAPALNAAIAALLASGKHVLLIDLGAELATASLAALGPVLTEKIGAQTGRYFPAYLDRLIAEGVVRGLRNWLRAIGEPGTEERAQCERWLHAALETLAHRPGYTALIAELRSALRSHPALSEFAGAAFEGLRRELAANAGMQQARLAQTIGEAAREAGRVLLQSPELQATLNAGLEGAVIDYIAPWRAGIADFLADVVASWDTQTVVALIELEAGSDLQFVRINGTLAGALIGVVLFLMSAALQV